MKQTLYIFSAALLFTACNSSETKDETKKTETTTTTTVAAAPAKETPLPAPPMDSATMMKNWQDYMTPGAMHKMLALSNGKWKGEAKMWMSPDAPPTSNMMEMENKMILGGRYQESRSTGKFNGMPFEGVGTTAYDNAKKTFISTWVDNFGTGIMVMEGPYDETTKTLTVKGKCIDPMTGKETEMRQVLKIVDDKNQLMTMYTTPAGGKEFKSMEIAMVKK